MVSVESELTPIMVGAFAIPDNQIEECLTQATTEPNGQPRRRIPQQNHNPTVFRNLVFTTWYAHGLRAIDISNPFTPREVGYALAIPQGVARTYPVFKDGLIYWVDNDTGLHGARYTGPRRDELPGPGSGKPVPSLEIVHERPYHLFVISQDMEHFQHIHPEQQPDLTWAIDVTLPKAGYYSVLSDFLPSGGASQLISRPLVTAGYAGDLAADSARLVPDTNLVK